MNPYAAAYHSLLTNCSERLSWQIRRFEAEGLIRMIVGKQPLNVWYYKPHAWNQDAPVLFVMHGVKRNARNYHRSWRAHAETHNVLLLVPEFSRSHYPGPGKYHFGNTFSTAGQPIAPTQWTYTVIEYIFDMMKMLLGFYASTYSIYGHSAGAQFVHRMVLFLPEARIDRAICANAGWYLVPTYERIFPYGLRASGIPEHSLRKAFAKHLLILLGEHDTHPAHKYLKQTCRAQAQGENRYERGHYFYRAAQQEAARLHVPFNWDLRIVQGAGHNNTRMAAEAVHILYRRLPEHINPSLQARGASYGVIADA